MVEVVTDSGPAQRKYDFGDGSSALARAQSDRAALCLCQALDDREAETGAAALGGEERSEDLIANLV
jgi:hypothetical protein